MARIVGTSDEDWVVAVSADFDLLKCLVVVSDDFVQLRFVIVGDADP